MYLIPLWGSRRISCPHPIMTCKVWGVTGVSVHCLEKTKLKPEQVKQWLESQDVYTLHKPVRYKFPRRKVVVAGPNQQWQADLIDVSRLSRHNQGNKFLLTCIDVFYKKAWVVPLKDKTGSSLLKAFQSIDHPLPKTLQMDKGTEFTNRKFQKWLSEKGIQFFTSENDDIKASIVERFNRNLKSKLWRYFTRHDTLTYVDILDSVVDVYNRTPKFSLSWNGKWHNLPNLYWLIIQMKSWRELSILRNCKRSPRQMTYIEWRKYWGGQRIKSLWNGRAIPTSSTVGCMWKILCDFSFGHTSAFRECCLSDDLSDERGRSFVIWGRLCGCERLYKLKHNDFILSVMENVDTRTWCCSGSRVPKSEIVYFCQVFLILCIVIVSIYNLTNQQGDQQMWVALLSSCMGYLLPNPSIKSWVISISFYPPTTPWGYYPENTLAQFTSRLPNVINLSGDWEVGLVEIQYPHNSFNVPIVKRHRTLHCGLLPPMTRTEALSDVPSLSERAIIPISTIC